MRFANGQSRKIFVTLFVVNMIKKNIELTPRRAKMTINRKRRSNRDAIACIELIMEATKLDKAVQYLVTLNTRSRRTHLYKRTMNTVEFSSEDHQVPKFKTC